MSPKKKKKRQTLASFHLKNQKAMSDFLFLSYFEKMKQLKLRFAVEVGMVLNDGKKIRCVFL